MTIAFSCVLQMAVLQCCFIFICRDVSEKLADSMSYLEKAEELLKSYHNQNDGDETKWYLFKILLYKGDTNRSFGKYNESR